MFVLWYLGFRRIQSESILLQLFWKEALNELPSDVSIRTSTSLKIPRRSSLCLATWAFFITYRHRNHQLFITFPNFSEPEADQLRVLSCPTRGPRCTGILWPHHGPPEWYVFRTATIGLELISFCFFRRLSFIFVPHLKSAHNWPIFSESLWMPQYQTGEMFHYFSTPKSHELRCYFLCFSLSDQCND